MTRTYGLESHHLYIYMNSRKPRIQVKTSNPIPSMLSIRYEFNLYKYKTIQN